MVNHPFGFGGSLAAATLCLGAACGGSVTGSPSDAMAIDASQPADASLDVRARMADGALARSDALDSRTDASMAQDGGSQEEPTPIGASDGTVEGDATIDSNVDSGSAYQYFDADVADACRPLSGNACISCCASQFSTGRAELDLVGTPCQCSGCSDACTASVCRMHDLPQSPCISCVQQAVAGECVRNDYLTRYCGDNECRSYVTCLTQCSPN